MSQRISYLVSVFGSFEYTCPTPVSTRVAKRTYALGVMYNGNSLL